jgi:AraC-like DNA-binding protein
MDSDLTALVAARATAEGTSESPYPGLRYVRVSQPVTFRKTLTFGPMLTVTAQGRKRATFGDREVSYDPRRYLLVTGEASFGGCVVEASPEHPYLAVCFSIPADAVAKTLLALTEAEAEVEGAAETIPAFTSPLDEQIRGAVIRLVRAVDDPLERRIVAPMIVEELVLRLLRSDDAAAIRSAVPRGPDADAVRKAIQFMRANARRPLSVEAVARHVAMSPSHFAHRFRAVARVSPMRYLKQLRMDEARRLLVAGGLRAGEAAVRVGYESASHFARDFKATYGATPAAYARRTRAEPEAAAALGSQE